MRIEYLSQPINSSGDIITLEELILDCLYSTEPFFTNIWIVSAFAKVSGLSELIPALRTAKNNGANINIILGIDLKGTSYEALVEILNLGVRAKIFKNRRPGHTFHPKLFVFEAPDIQGEIFVGSNNLTFGGLLSNYEASSRIYYDLSIENDLFQQAKIELSRFLQPPDDVSYELTQELINLMYQREDIISETQMSTLRDQLRETPSQQIPNDENSLETPFGVEDIATRRRPRTQRPQTHIPSFIPIQTGPETDTPLHDRQLIWRKSNLPASDVQRQQGNPTGGLRLTQAGFRVNGEVIDQTSYFRYEIFGDLNWTIGENPPEKQETINLPSEIYINGQYFGQHILGVSHKPSGEAGQGNYTTMLHWRSLSSTIYELDLRGKSFSFYSPRTGAQLPYLIIIE